MNESSEQGEASTAASSSSTAPLHPGSGNSPRNSPPQNDPTEDKPKEEENAAARPTSSETATTVGSGVEGKRAYVPVPACGDGFYRLYKDNKDPVCRCAFCRCERTVQVGTVCIDCQVQCEDPERSHF